VREGWEFFFFVDTCMGWLVWLTDDQMMDYNEKDMYTTVPVPYEH